MNPELVNLSFNGLFDGDRHDLLLSKTMAQGRYLKSKAGGGLISKEGTLIYVTDALLGILNCSSKNIIGRTLRDFIDEPSYKKLKRFINNKNEEILSFITLSQEKGGHKTYLYFEIYPPLQGRQEFGFYVKPYSTEKIIKTTISDKKYLETIVSNINAVVWIRTPDAQKYLYMSPNYKKFFGMTLEEYYQNPNGFFDRVHPEDHERFLQEYFTITPESYYRYKMPDGAWKYFSVYRFTLNDCEDIPQLIGGITVDNTNLYKAQVSLAEKKKELKQQNQHLVKLNEMLENFTMLACHDMTQPLRIFSAYTKMLENKYLQTRDENGTHLFSGIKAAIHRMKDLIQGMADLSLIQNGVATKKPCNVSRMLATVIEPMFINDVNPGFILEYGKLTEVEANEDHITSLFKNLIENSIKYNENIPYIKIWSKRFSKGTVYAIQDNGIGIPEHSHRQIFSLGYRLPEATQREGTGIGLSACEKLMAIYKGKIWVHSRPGGGSTFYLLFPLC